MFELVPFSRAAVSLLVVPYRFFIRSCVRTPLGFQVGPSYVPYAFTVGPPMCFPVRYTMHVFPVIFLLHISPEVNVGFSVPFRVLLRAFIVKTVQFLSVSCSFCGRFLVFSVHGSLCCPMDFSLFLQWALAIYMPSLFVTLRFSFAF